MTVATNKLHMKFHKILSIILFSAVISLYACNNNSDKKETDISTAPVDVNAAPQEVPIQSPNVPTPSPNTTQQGVVNQNPNPPEPAQNAAGLWHYTCSKGCAGGAGAAGNCSVCGNPLTHNAAYHGSTQATGANAAAPKPVDPPQNAKGVWHYTCGKGCAGGAGAAGNCSVCGGPLAHNATYHL